MSRGGPTQRDRELREATAARVRFLLVKQNRSQSWLASRLRGGKGAVIRLLNAGRPITIELIEDLARAFEMPPIQFLVGPGQPVWPTGDIEAQEAAIRRMALDDVGAKLASRFVSFEESFLRDLIHQSTKVAAELEGLGQRLLPFAHDASIDSNKREVLILDAINRELARQDHPEGTPRRASKEVGGPNNGA